MSINGRTLTLDSNGANTDEVFTDVGGDDRRLNWTGYIGTGGSCGPAPRRALLTGYAAMTHWRSPMRKLTPATMLLAVLLPAVSVAAESRPVDQFQSWPALATDGDFDVKPMTEKRIGFTLGLEARGRRVIVVISAFRKSGAASGYTNDLAFDVNGEVMGLNLGDRPRLLNRPMTFRFAPNGSREQVAGVKGVLGLIENWGSARWTLPATPSIEAWLKSADYSPTDLPDPAWLVLEVTDLVHADAYNYVTVKNESRNATVRCEKVSIHHDVSEAEAIQAVYERLKEKYLGRTAIVREPAIGREWVYDMDLVASSHGASGSMADIQSIEDARRVVKPLKEDGYSAMIVSGLHMRYTYTEYWESRVVPYMKYLCQAAHEAGMRVLDHYDVPIFFSRGYPFLLEDDHLEWTQRDIRYGTPTRMYCINNPHFREHFFTFTRRVQKETGVDGYQIDEVYFFDKNFCGCEPCRSQFEQETGFALPREADSPVFFNDAHPLWRLFQLWRRTSQQRFKRDFLASIHQVNPAAILSQYTTTHYSPSRRGGAWGNFIISYAVGKEGVTRLPMHDYRYGLADFRLDSGVADATGHATWMLWYPLTSSAARFCWAMSQASNCGQWHSRTWRGAVRELISWPHKTKKFDFTTFADVAMIFSEKSKDASMWTGHYHGMETLGWGEAMVEHNVQYHNLHEVAVTAELLSRYRLVILPQMTMIDEDNGKAIESYVRDGGTLVVTGESGMIDERGRPRPDFLLGEMMNVRFVELLNAPFDVVEGGFTYDLDRMFYHYGKRMLHVELRDPAKSRVLVRFRKNGKEYPGVVESTYGKGKVVTVASFFGVSNFKVGLHEGRKPIFKTNPDSAPFMTRLLRDLLGSGETVVAVELPPRIVYTTWIDKAGGREIDIHFLNVADYRPLKPDETGRRRKIEFPLVDDEMTMLLRGRDVSSATFYSPDTPDAVACRVESAPDGTRITVPGAKMKMYGLLKTQSTVTGGAQ